MARHRSMCASTVRHAGHPGSAPLASPCGLPLPAVAALVMMAAFLWLPGVSRAQCIDYAGYSHWVGSVSAGCAIEHVAVSGSYAFVPAEFQCEYEYALQVIDISNPASPQVVGSAGTSGYPLCVGVSGSYACVPCVGGNGTTRLDVIDISNPASPRVAGRVDMPGLGRDLASSGADACIAADPH